MKVIIKNNGNGNVEISFFVPNDKFGTAVNVIKKYGGSFDKDAKAWVFNTVPTPLVTELEALGIKVPTEMKNYMYDAIVTGNYYFVPQMLRDKINFARLMYDVYRYDPYTREYKVVTIRLWIDVENGVLVPRGLAREALKELKIQPFAPWLDPNMPLSQGYRDYQIEVIRSALNDLRLTGTATVMMATGGGKSYMVAGLVKDLINNYPKKVRKVYYLATSIDLVLQFKQFAEKWRLNVGVVTGDKKEYDKPVVAATIQTLYRALEEEKNGNDNGNGNGDEEEEKVIEQYLDEVELTQNEKIALAKDYLTADLVIIDEAHHVPARTVKRVTLANKHALRLALSATPWRSDGRDLEIYAAVGSITQRRVTSSELIDRGYLVPAHIIMWKRLIYCPEIMRAMRSGYEGAQLYMVAKRCVFGNEERKRDIADVVEYLVKAGLRPVLVLTKEVKPAKELHKELTSRGLKAELVIGAVKGSKRREIFDKVESLDALIADTVADEGLDLPQLRALVLTGGGASKTRTLQRVGRAVRPWKNKKIAVVVDLVDITKYFSQHGYEREKLYRREPRWRIMEAKSKEEVYQLIEALAQQAQTQE